MAWTNSTRRCRLPADWQTHIRPRILQRDPTCRCRGCTRCAKAGCTRRSTEVDHVVPIDDHRDENLQGLCKPCHQRKTIRERPQPQLPPRARPDSRAHPGWGVASTAATPGPWGHSASDSARNMTSEG